MLQLPYPGNLMGLCAVPPHPKDPADYFIACVGGGEAKTGVANAVVRRLFLAVP
jgi:hypothetical protein